MSKFHQTRAFCLFGIFMSGAEFNKKHPETSYKFLHSDHRHHGMTYKKGSNKDPLPFSSCNRQSGLHFTQKPELWIDYYVYKVAYVSIPPDAKVYYEDDQTKADCIELSEIINVEDMKEWNDVNFCLNMVKKMDII